MKMINLPDKGDLERVSVKYDDKIKCLYWKRYSPDGVCPFKPVKVEEKVVCSIEGFYHLSLCPITDQDECNKVAHIWLETDTVSSRQLIVTAEQLLQAEENNEKVDKKRGNQSPSVTGIKPKKKRKKRKKVTLKKLTEF